LFGIARHAVNDHFRAKRRRHWLSLDILRERAGDGPDPEHQAIDAEAREGMLTAVARLSERERDIVGLKFAAGLSNRRIAELTDLKEGNVAVILYRAIRRLRKELRAEEQTS
jgi:RNA polymerase sigma-70 factor (ECF subfamily)